MGLGEFGSVLLLVLRVGDLLSGGERDQCRDPGVPAACQPYADVLAGRSMLVKKAEPLAAECIVRGYVSGSGWKDYKATGSICGSLYSF